MFDFLHKEHEKLDALAAQMRASADRGMHDVAGYLEGLAHRIREALGGGVEKSTAEVADLGDDIAEAVKGK